MGAADRSHTWQTQEITELCEAIACLRSPDEVGHFLRDLCTMSELEAMAHRWQAARLLDEGLPYLEISKRTHASTTTVTRVAHWLRYGEGGYRLVLDRLKRRRATA
jgi:TrpR-related protein YerC/YecD